MKIVNVIGCCISGGAEILVKEFLINFKKNVNINLELWVMYKLKDSNISVNEKTLSFEREYIEGATRFMIKSHNLLKRF